MQTNDYQQLIDSAAYQQASLRVLRQLLEALLFEQALPHCVWGPVDDGNEQTLTLEGRRNDGAQLSYRCQARRTFSFGRIRVVAPLQRVDSGVVTDASDPALFLAEMAPWMNADAERLGQFAGELLATQIKDAQTLYARAGQVLRGADYDTIEARLTDGHPYHPSYKSRLGFTLLDNRAYAPEFGTAITPLLLAVRRDCSDWAISATVAPIDSTGFDASGELGAIPRLLMGPLDAQRFDAALSARGLAPQDYLPLPVHPWQWDEAIVPLYHQALARAQLVAIGPLADSYIAQQSIRTLANVSERGRLSLKLAMNLVNTSTARVLASHTVQNAAAISDWLATLVERSDWPQPLRRPVLLREVAGVSFTPQAPAQGQYGALACIWRDSVHRHLHVAEAAVPMTAVLHVDADECPFIDPWIKRHGAVLWLQRLVERALLPVLHLLWEHGVALESHAQNMILLHEDGLPARVALKDFHDGVRFSSALLSGPAPTLCAPPSAHARVNPNSFLETLDADELRDFTFDALFFVNLAELAWLFARFYQIDEERFWRIVQQVIQNYQSDNAHRAARYRQFDCFADQVAIELLASRRFLPEIRLRTRLAPNPLRVRPDTQGEVR